MLTDPYYAEFMARQMRETNERNARTYTRRHPELPRVRRFTTWHLPRFHRGRNRAGLHAASA